MLPYNATYYLLKDTFPNNNDLFLIDSINNSFNRRLKFLDQALDNRDATLTKLYDKLVDEFYYLII